jgi:hypothetical protein
MMLLNAARTCSTFTRGRVVRCRVVRCRFVAVLLVLAAGFGAVGCGPQQKFCPDASDGVCVAPMEAAAPADATDANPDADSGAIYIGVDAPTAATGAAGAGADAAGDSPPAN